MKIIKNCLKFKECMNVIVLLLAGAVCLILAPGALAQQQPSIATEGEYLPNEPFLLPRSQVNKLFDLPSPQLPPPEFHYETRLGWLIGANADYHRFFNIQAESTERDFAWAIHTEMKRVAKLESEARAAYLTGMIRDLGTLELTDLDNRWMTQIAKAAYFDFMLGGLGSAGLSAMSIKGMAEFASSGVTSVVADQISQYLKNPRSLSEARLALLRQYITERCGCALPMEGRFVQGMSYDLAVAAVRNKYNTRLGHLIATGGKGRTATQLIIDQRQYLVNQEFAQLKELRSKKPQEFAAYLINFSYDIEMLQTELLEDQRSSPGVSIIINLGLGAVAAATGPQMPVAQALFDKAMTLTVGAISDSAAGAALSGSYTALAEWGSLSEEKKLMASLAALRRVTLQGIRSLPGDCGCKPASVKKKKPVETGFDTALGSGYWLVARGQYLDFDYGSKEDVVRRNGKEAVLEGPFPGSREKAVRAVCSKISNPRFDSSPLNRGFYGEYKGLTFNIGRLGGCGVKGD